MFLKKLDEHLLQAINEAGLEKAYELQKKSISKIKSGADFVCVSDLGTGKSTAITIGVIQQLKAELNDVPRAVIVVPEKEDAERLKEQFDILGKHTDLRVNCVLPVAPRKLNDQRDLIYYGTDVVIGTAKAINDLYSHSGINLNDLKMLIIDDAEIVMRQNVISQIDRLTETVLHVQIIQFANNLSERVYRYADLYQKDPEILEFYDEDEEEGEE
ncbi:MAG: DEAD/DEAH box helicase [Bacteroidales bacterium]|nr:DEAD/DEAH box helicase [Bacteroidales bacterium]